MEKTFSRTRCKILLLIFIEYIKVETAKEKGKPISYLENIKQKYISLRSTRSIKEEIGNFKLIINRGN